MSTNDEKRNLIATTISSECDDVTVDKQLLEHDVNISDMTMEQKRSKLLEILLVTLPPADEVENGLNHAMNQHMLDYLITCVDQPLLQDEKFIQQWSAFRDHLWDLSSRHDNSWQVIKDSKLYFISHHTTNSQEGPMYTVNCNLGVSLMTKEEIQQLFEGIFIDKHFEQTE